MPDLGEWWVCQFTFTPNELNGTPEAQQFLGEQFIDNLRRHLAFGWALDAAPEVEEIDNGNGTVTIRATARLHRT